MRVVLCEAANTHQTMQRTRWLIAMHIAKFCKLYRQIAVRLKTMLKYLNVARAVHRLQSKHAVIVGIITGNSDLEHVVAIPTPVTGSLPKRLVQHLWRIDLLIAMAVETTTHISYQRLEHTPAFGVPEHNARTFFLEMEQVHFATKAAVITLFSFFKHMKIGVEIIVVGKCRTVDTCQHRIVGITAPVSACNLHQLEGIADLAGGRHMRPTAEIEPFTLIVDLQILTFRDRIDELDLVAFTLIGKNLLGLLARPNLLGERLVALNDFAHLLFDHRQIIWRERFVTREVVIEAILDDWADRYLRSREKLLHGFSQNVSRVVTDQFQRARIFAGQNFDGTGSTQRIGKITHGAIHGISHGFLCK